MARRSMADGPSWLVMRPGRVWANCTEPVEADGLLTFTCANQEHTVPAEGTAVNKCEPHGVFEHVIRD